MLAWALGRWTAVRRLTDFGFDPAWSPGGAELIVATEPIKILPAAPPRASPLREAGRNRFFDTRSGRAKPILPPGTIATGWAMKFSLSRDDRHIAYLQTQRDGDIWLMHLRPENPERKP